MSGRKIGSSKISLNMLKGKPITTSVPTFAIRFHAEDEELEEVYTYSQEAEKATSEKTDLREEDESSRASTPSNSSVTISQHPLGGSSREISPSKECPSKLGKRSSSVDSVGSAAATASSVSDTWNIFHELRGKIVKRVEETLSKSDRSGKKLATGPRLGSCRGSHENSSISDSEDGSVPVVSSDEAHLKESIAKSEVDPLISEFDDKDETPLANEVTFFIGDTESRIDDSILRETLPRKGFETRKRIRPLLGETRAHHWDSSSSAQTTSTQPIISSMSSLFSRREAAKQEVEYEDDIDEEFEVLGVDSPEEAEEVREETPLIAELTLGASYSQPEWARYNPSCMGGCDPHQTIESANYAWVGWSKPTLFAIFSSISILPFILPSFLSGIFLGIFFSIPAGLLVHWWHYGCWLPSYIKSPRKSAAWEAFAVPDYGKLPILEVPAAKEYQPIPRYEGWMNQYPNDYDPDTYHVGATKSVLVRLEGNILRLSYTQSRISRRAMWNEMPNLRVPVCHWMDYNINSCPILLQPDGLARKRLWSKKYPICIVLRKDSILSTNFGSNDVEEDVGITSVDKIDCTRDAEESTTEKETYSKDSDDATDGENSLGSNVNYPTLMPVQLNEDDDQWSLSEEETYCPIGGEIIKTPGKRLYLFARTDREKDDWFRRFVNASRSKPTPTEDENSIDDIEFDCENRANPQFTPDDHTPDSDTFRSWSDSNQPSDAEFQRFIGRFLNKNPTSQSSESTSGPTTPTHGPSKKGAAVDSSDKEDNESLKDLAEGLTEDENELKSASLKSVSPDTMWANALLARVLFDVLRDRFWVDKIQERIQRKLSAIKLPYFMEHLLVSELDLGRSIPIIHRASRPIQDERGLWVDLDITYEGQARMTLETRLNLMRLKKSGGVVSNGSTDPPERQSPTEKDTSRSPMFDSDMEDSAESSSDEEVIDNKTDESHGTPTSSASKRILRMVDKIAASKYFQQATEYKYIKRAMEGVSNTRLILSVELKGVVGTLALNIPPPPSDRLWYGFRTNPRLWLSARPKLGERQVNITHITDWIENKLCIELQKIFVLPNMDDLVIPVMSTRLPQ